MGGLPSYQVRVRPGSSGGSRMDPPGGHQDTLSHRIPNNPPLSPRYRAISRGPDIPCPQGREGSSPFSGTNRQRKGSFHQRELPFSHAVAAREGFERARIAERLARMSATHASAEDPSPAAKAEAMGGRRLRRAPSSSGTIYFSWSSTTKLRVLGTEVRFPVHGVIFSYPLSCLRFRH